MSAAKKKGVRTAVRRRSRITPAERKKWHDEYQREQIEQERRDFWRQAFVAASGAGLETRNAIASAREAVKAFDADFSKGGAK